jgi:hypothetical protein
MAGATRSAPLTSGTSGVPGNPISRAVDALESSAGLPRAVCVPPKAGGRTSSGRAERGNPHLVIWQSGDRADRGAS